jgi:hypothetical protein
MIGRTEEAEELFERLLALRNDLGLLSEEYDAHHGRLVGNFPQAFSHVSLVNSACRLTGHDTLATMAEMEKAEAGRGARVVDHSLALLPSMSRPPKRKRTHVVRRRGAGRR